jgi:hypothetical protein
MGWRDASWVSAAPHNAAHGSGVYTSEPCTTRFAEAEGR